MTIDEMIAQYIKEKIHTVIDSTVRGPELTDYINAVAHDAVQGVVEDYIDNWFSNNIDDIVCKIENRIDWQEQVNEVVQNLSFTVEVN